MACVMIAGICGAQNEPFTKRTVIAGLNSPWEITYGPNDSLWVTENVTYLVKRVDIATGASTQLLNLAGARNFYSGDAGRWPQGGLMGMALHPALYDQDAAVRAAKPWVYLAYVFSRPTGQDCSTNPNSSGPCNFLTRIVRYNYNGSSLSSPVTVLDNIPGSNDHNSGRLMIGPDLKLYYTVGDLGAGQFNNGSRTNNAQNVDVMEGKVLRLNLESDGDAGVDAFVPDDNPFYNASAITPRDYVFTMGHRNAQGLTWANINGTNRIYTSEHGDRSDDEVNLLVGGGNYGWNRVSGECDGNYNGLTLGGYSPVNENTFCSTTPTNHEPIKTLFTINQSQINSLSSDFLTWPTVAPSSIDIYTAGRIPGWQNCLLIPCLKAGRVYRIKLNTAGTDLVNITGSVDTASYFRGEGRFRDLAISPDGMKIFLACDASGQTSGPTGGFNNGGSAPPNAGRILEFTYSGIVLPVRDPDLVQVREHQKQIKIFPVPASDHLTILIEGEGQKPFTAQFYSSTGQLMFQKMLLKTENQLGISRLRPGIYYVQLYDANGKLWDTRKVAVK